MSSKVNFYLLKTSSPEDAAYFACRLTEQAFLKGLSVYINTDTETQAQRMDDLLWEFRPESFIPHTIVGSDSEEEVSVLIGHDTVYQGSGKLLINLANAVPDFHQGFETVAEIVLNDEQDKAAKRQHWSTYQSLGHELQRHPIG